MARVKRYLDSRASDSQERWLVSYADFITLLFAFFVVMYAISSVNEGRYREMGSSIGVAFGVQNHQEKSFSFLTRKAAAGSRGLAIDLGAETLFAAGQAALR